MQKQISEAPESNAGDDFHVLWTMKKTFNLLNFEDNGLKAITIEGIDPKNSLKLDPYGNKLLGVDIAEYFGGENFNDAEKVVVSQLKYSTRRVNENWTFSKLYSGKKSGNTDGSVFHRLSQIYKTFLDEYGRDLVLKKLSLKLVSNRELSQKQKQIIIDIQGFLIKRTSRTYTKTVYSHYPVNELTLKKIHKSTNLNSSEFIDFLRLLDFNDCGTNSSYYQELQIIEALRNVGIQNLNQTDSLFRMVWRKMLPDAIARRQNKITDIDLLNCLQMSFDRLFPVSQSFEEISKLVERKQVPTLINDIIKNDTVNPICIHGGAGIGKSTISQLIKQNFPKNSEVILFDCYGAGSYLNPSDSRHLHKEALLQISNEIAKRTGSPFLLYTDNESHILIREFKSRIEDAIRILRKRSPDSLLVLIVDAADNSVTAAQKNQTISFIQDLVNEIFADGFRLIVTSRSHRVQSLGLPEKYIDIPLKPFDLDESGVHLKFHFPKSLKEEITDFHNLTNGIPRVQTYALELKKEGIKQVINYLKPSGKKVEDLIQERIFESVRKLGNNGQSIVNTFFTYLISLPRPVPISYIETIAGVSKGLLLDLSTDIWHGLVLDNNQLSFRDEDFESYVREKYQLNEDIYVKIANLFLSKANEDEYASINLGIALFNAKKSETLKNIVLNEEYIDVPSDPIRKKEVYIERTKLAMKVSSDTDDKLTFFKLTFVAADAAKTDIALNNLLIQNADLTASFGETDSLHRLHLQSKEKSWSGSFHYQLAVIYSRKLNSKELAKKHLKIAEKWVRWLMQYKNTDEFSDYRITNEDIANGAEAYLRIFDSKVAFNWLNQWSPKEVLLQAINNLLEEVVKYSDEEQIIKWLKPLNLPIYAKLIVLKKIKFSKTYPFDLNHIIDAILRLLSRGVKFKIHLIPLIISFCESYINLYPSNKQNVLNILENINVQLPDHVPTLMNNSISDDNRKEMIDSFLKKMALKSVLTNTSLKLDSIYPKKFKETENEEDYEARSSRVNEKRKFDSFYNHAISIYQFRADVLTNNEKDNLTSRFNEICDRIKKDWDFKYYDATWVQYKLNFLALILVNVLAYIKNGEELIETVVTSFEHKKQNRITLRIAIAKKLSLSKDYKQSIYILLDEIDSIIQESAFTSSEMVNYYIQSAKIVINTDKEVSKYYFEKAIEAVSEIDIEAQEQIKCLYELSKLGITNENPKLAFEFARFVEYCESRLNGYDNFPLEEGIKGIAFLDCSTSYAIICKLNHRYKAKITEHILSILLVSLKKDFITPAIGSSMLPINIYYWISYVEYINLLITKIDDIQDNNQKSIFVKNTLKDIQINCTRFNKKETTESIYDSIKDGKYINGNILQDFAIYHQFISDLDYNIKEQNSYSKKVEIKKEAETDSYKVIDLKDVNFFSSSSLNYAIKNIISNDEFYFAIPQISKFLTDIKDACGHDKYVNHLDALININPKLVNLSIFEDALKERLVNWKFHPLVKQWMKQNFRKTLKIWFSEFSWNDQIDYIGIRKFADIFSIHDSELATIIFEILPEKIDELSATSLYQTIAFQKNQLNKKENEYLISWILPKWNSKIRVDFADGVWEDKHQPSRDPDEVIAQTIRFILGYPDKRLRWRGMHALRRIVNSGNSSILKLLLAKQNTTNCSPFQHQDYTYFWISAKLYLWICIERLSQETPSIISQFQTEIFHESQNKDLPHVLILYFIKQTCLNLIKYDSSLFTEDEISTINKLVISQLEPIKEESLKREQRKYNTQAGEWKFDFDLMDTLPYLYNRLGRCFNLSEYDVADLSDKYIVEKWGYVGKVLNDDHIEEGWELTSNRKGSLPVVENLRNYYEYHGMFCAASELLEKEPLLETEPYSWASWEHWLESETLTWKKFWLSDLRNPIPLDRKFWVNEYNTFDEKWRDNVEDSYYDEVSGFIPNSDLAYVQVFGGFTRYFGKNYERVAIRSAIVTPQTSESLLRALQTAKDNYNYHVPLENDDSQIEEDNFILLGWLKQISSEYDRLEKDDPFSHEESKSYIKLGEVVEELFHINYSDDFKQAFYKKEKIFENQNWSDESDKQRYDSFESSGELAKVKIKFLLEFLKKREVDLILTVTISRWLKERNSDYGKKKRENETKLYLIKSNGEVKTVRGNSYKIR